MKVHSIHPKLISFYDIVTDCDRYNSVALISVLLYYSIFALTWTLPALNIQCYFCMVSATLLNCKTAENLIQYPLYMYSNSGPSPV